MTSSIDTTDTRGSESPTHTTLLLTNGQSNLTRPYRRRIRTVHSYSPGCANVPHVTHASFDLPEFHRPNGISIGSVIWTCFTAECRLACPGMYFSLKIALRHFRMGYLDPHLIHGFFSPPEPATQTASRSVQPFLYRSNCSRQSVVVHIGTCPSP